MKNPANKYTFLVAMFPVKTFAEQGKQLVYTAYLSFRHSCGLSWPVILYLAGKLVSTFLRAGLVLIYCREQVLKVFFQ